MIALFHFDWVRLNDRIEVLATESPTSTEALRSKKIFTHWVVCSLPSFWSGCLLSLLLIIFQL